MLVLCPRTGTVLIDFLVLSAYLWVMIILLDSFLLSIIPTFAYYILMANSVNFVLLKLYEPLIYSKVFNIEKQKKQKKQRREMAAVYGKI